MSLAKFFGDTSKLDRFAKALGAERIRPFLYALNKDLADELLSLTKEGFTRSEAPSGTKWLKLKRKADASRQPLIRTGALQHSFRARSTDKTAEVFSVKPYAAFHQYGTSHMRARPMTPTGSALSPRWKNRLRAIIEKHLAKLAKVRQ